MEQRPLRLGDIVDDYCPRERRITNHAVVAIVGDVIKQTRCATCDAEHAYKDAKVPRRTTLRKKDDAPGQLIPSRVPPAAAGPQGAETEDTETVETATPSSEDAPLDQAAQSDDTETTSEQQNDDGATAWFGHRPLIRATLPRTEADPPPARPIPEFTMHQRNTRGARAFRQDHGWQGNGHSPNGARQDRGGFNQRGGGHGHGQGRHGQGGNANRHRGGGGKRSR
jgi:hypothetical protein